MTYHSAPWPSRLLALAVDMGLFMLIFLALAPDREYLTNYPLARFYIYFFPLAFTFYRMIGMVLFARTAGMWFFGLRFHEVDENGALMLSSGVHGIHPRQALKRIGWNIVYNLMLGIPYIELLYSLDGLHPLDRKSRVFLIGRVRAPEETV